MRQLSLHDSHTNSDLATGELPDNPWRLLITIPTYNEKGNLPDLVAELFRCVPDCEILVIDDNSPDGTGAWCDAKSAEEPRLTCIHRRAKMGIGGAILTGMRHAVDHGYYLMLNMDADFSHHPRHIPEILARLGPAGQSDCDVVIGSRYVAGGRIKGWSAGRYLISRAVNWYARWMLRLEPQDCSGAFRCYRVAILRELDWTTIRSRGYSFQEEILWHLRRSGARLREVPITFVGRVRGKSKISVLEALNSIWVLMRLGLTSWLRI